MEPNTLPNGTHRFAITVGPVAVPISFDLLETAAKDRHNRELNLARNVDRSKKPSGGGAF
jgi:hypothetical protein